jgi:hypothetical protein
MSGFRQKPAAAMGENKCQKKFSPSGDETGDFFFKSHHALPGLIFPMHFPLDQSSLLLQRNEVGISKLPICHRNPAWGRVSRDK